MKKSVNKNKKRVSLFTKRNILIGAVLLLVLLPLGLYAYNKWLDYHDESRFRSMKLHMDSLATVLGQDTPSAGWIVNTACQEASVKFQEADMSCSVSIANKLKIDSAAEVRNLIDQVDSAVQRNDFKLLDNNRKYPFLDDGVLIDTDKIPSTRSYDPFGAIVYRSERSGMECTLLTEITNEQASFLNTDILCDDKVRKKYF